MTKQPALAREPRALPDHRRKSFAAAALLPVALVALAAFAPGQADAATQLPNFGSFATAGFSTLGAGAVWNEGGLGDFDASLSRTTSAYTVAAVANLATGSLHASSAVFRTRPCGGLNRCDRLAASASAVLRDRYIFTNAGENFALIPVNLRVGGHCGGNVHARARFKFGFSASQPVDSSAIPYREIACGESVDVVAPINLVSFIGDTSYFAYVELATNALLPDGTDGFSLADFGNTLKIDIVLPEGVTARSASGVFPFQSPAAGVPEPASWALMILGFGGAGAALRRRRLAAA